jgi:hypothetical protein
MVSPIGTSLLTCLTAPCGATLELVPSSLLESTSPSAAPLTAPRAATSASTATRRVTPTVPPGFLPRAAPTTPTAPRVDLAVLVASCAAPTTPATSRAAPMTPTSPVQRPGPPSWVWPSSPIAYIHRPRQPTAPTTPAPPTLMTPAHRPVTAVPVTPLVNPHQMVTCAKGWLPNASGASHPHRHDHLDAIVSNLDLCSRRACQSKLECGHRGRIQGPAEQWDLGICSSAS